MMMKSRYKITTLSGHWTLTNQVSEAENQCGACAAQLSFYSPACQPPQTPSSCSPAPRRSPVCFPSCQQTRPGHAGPRRARLSPNGRLPPIVVSKTDAHKYSTPARASRNASVECGRQSRPATWKPRGPLQRGGPLGGLCRSSPHESDGTSSALYSAAKRGLESGGEDSAC